jgi:predicted adenine nucleotide alpha hydrolase (AANH) superfamily ATPase
MLVHICCSVDSHYFLQRIQKEYPDEKLIGFFYDPNIHPYSEYRLRYLDVEYSCKRLGIELIEGEYDLEGWLKATKGYEDAPEKGDRCTICFDNRLEVTIKKAIELGHDKFTTTLLISPKKSQDKLDKIGNELSSRYGLEFIFKDYRSGSGMQEQAKEVKDNSLYRQNYCGCLFALNAQREHQDKLADELISPISKQILPESIEERIELYKKRNTLENPGIIKQRFLNYRLLSAKVVYQKEVIPAYFICYSTLKNKKTKAKIEKIVSEVGYLNRDEVKVVTLDRFNTLANTLYKNIYELTYSPLSFEDEMIVRNKILNSSYFDLSCVVVLDTLVDGNMEVFLDAKVYDDVREVLL